MPSPAQRCRHLPPLPGPAQAGAGTGAACRPDRRRGHACPGLGPDRRGVTPAAAREIGPRYARDTFVGANSGEAERIRQPGLDRRAVHPGAADCALALADLRPRRQPRRKIFSELAFATIAAQDCPLLGARKRSSVDPDRLAFDDTPARQARVRRRRSTTRAWCNRRPAPRETARARPPGPGAVTACSIP